MPRKVQVLLLMIVIFTIVSCSDTVEQASEIKPEKPIFTIDSHFEPVENSVVVGILDATDPATSANVSFSIVPGTNDFDKFYIDSDGKTLKFIQAPDFEDINQRVFNVQIEAKSKLGATSALDLNISVTNDNDTAPIINSTLATLSVKENTVKVAELTATDVDGDEMAISFLLYPPATAIPAGGEQGADQSLFEIVNVDGKPTLMFVTPPDYETSTHYNLTLYADDSTNLGFLKIGVDLINVSVSPPNVTLAADMKRILFNLQPDPEAEYFELWEDADGLDGAKSYTKIADKISKDLIQYPIDIAVHNLDWINALYMVKACNQNGLNCEPSLDLSPKDIMLDSIGTLKGNNSESTDEFGAAISISKDGGTIAIGAVGESSSFQGICNSPSHPDQNNLITCSDKTYTDDDAAPLSGAVYIFRKNLAGVWFQEAYIKSANSEGKNALNPDSGDYFGANISLSGDGSLLAVGATGEDGASRGSRSGPFGPDEQDQVCAAPQTKTRAEDNCLLDSGAVYVFNRDASGLWSQEAYLKNGWPYPNLRFGRTVAWSGDGTVLAIGGYFGEVQVYLRYSVGNWRSGKTTLVQSNGATTGFSESISLSDDGATLAVGDPTEAGSFTGVCNGLNIPLSTTGAQTCDVTNATIVVDSLSTDSGAAYIYRRRIIQEMPTSTIDEWTQEAYIKASNAEVLAKFGASVSLNRDGTILAVGSPGENSDYEGVCNVQGLPNPTINTLCLGQSSISNVGAVYHFTYHKDFKWAQQSYIKPANTGVQLGVLIGDSFGSTVSLSNDGTLMAVGSPFEDGTFFGVNYGPGAPDMNFDPSVGCILNPPNTVIENNCTTDAGAIYVFSADALNKWHQQSYVKAITDFHWYEYYGSALSLSADGNMLIGGTVDSVNLY